MPNLQTPRTRIITAGNSGLTIITGGKGTTVVSNWWQAGGATGAIQVLQPKGAASYAASLLDLSGNGNNASEGVAPTWNTATGWTFNGTTQYLDSGIVPAPGYSMLLRYANADITTDRLNGVGANTANRFMLGWTGGPLTVYGAGGYVTSSNVATAGNLGLAGQFGFWNGVPDSIAISGSGWTQASTVYVGASNTAGALDFALEDVIAFVIYNNTVSDAAMLAVATAMALL